MFKLGLFLLALYAFLPPSLSYRQYPAAWKLSAPPRVLATRGSCVVIPCTFTIQKTHRIVNVFRGLWKKEEESFLVASSRPGYNINGAYNHRTTYLGAVDKFSCKWMLSNVKEEDAGGYFFRIELPQYRSYSWKSKKTYLQVVDAQPPVMHLSSVWIGGERVGLCSVVHSCPQKPPVLTWSTGGRGQSVLQQLDDWQWMTFSQVAIRPEKDDPKEVHCSAQYDGGQTVYSAPQWV